MNYIEMRFEKLEFRNRNGGPRARKRGSEE